MQRVVTYDISDDKRRNKVFKLLKDYGQWIQHSVFELEVSDMQWIEIEFALHRLLGEGDSLCVYPLCQSCSKKAYYLGKVRFLLEEEKDVII